MIPKNWRDLGPCGARRRSACRRAQAKVERAGEKEEQDAHRQAQEGCQIEGKTGQATFADETEATSGSVSHMTRLRP